MTGPTFRARLTTSMTFLATAVLAAASAVIYVGARHILTRNLDATLAAIARTEVSSAIDEPGGTVHVHDEEPGALALVNGSGYEKFALIKSADGRVNVQTSNLAGGPSLRTDPELEARALAGDLSFADVPHGEELFRGVYYPVQGMDGARFVAVVATPRHPMAHALSVLASALLATLVLGAGASAWGAARLARRLTRPLERIADAAEAIGETSLDARIPDVAGDAELRRVTRFLNAMLARLEAAFIAQRRFVADASHELRSPLANVRGTLEVALRHERSPEEYREAMRVSLREIERLGRLVGGLLVLSRADAGEMALERGHCDLVRVATQAIDAHGLRARECGVDVRLDGPATLSLVGDQDRLRAVVDNLLDNALRHAPRGSTVRVVVRQEGGRATLAVADAGPGLSAEEQTHVFDRFYRADAARGRDSGGLGLGLAIAKAIVETHGGRLCVESERGHGATFTLELPPAGPAEAARETPASTGV